MNFSPFQRTASYVESPDSPFPIGMSLVLALFLQKEADQVHHNGTMRLD
jgi:hypothetical protein